MNKSGMNVKLFVSNLFHICLVCRTELKRPRRICDACRASVGQAVLRRAQSLWYWYRLTFADYKTMIEAQHGRCALCGEPLGLGAAHSPAVVHDHTTGVIRGIVHQDCNRKLGRFGDNPAELERAAVYLRSAGTGHRATGNWRHGTKVQRQYRKKFSQKSNGILRGTHAL